MAAKPKYQSLPFDDAAKYFAGKIRLPTKTFLDIDGDKHAKAFVIAGAMKDEMLAQFQKAIHDGIKNGTTITEFRKQFDGIVKSHGWAYKGKRGWRTNVIFGTNINQAYQAGHWKRIEDDKIERPYLVYMSQDDGRVRDLHRAWHGTTLPVDDPWWNTHYPLNGYNCRCYVRQVSREEAEAEGYKIKEKSKPVKMEEVTVRAGGEDVKVETPAGITPGFAGNAGKAWGGGTKNNLTLEDKAMWRASLGELEEIENLHVFNPEERIKLKPSPVKVKNLKKASSIKEAKNIFESSIGGENKILEDPIGGVIRISSRLFKHARKKGDAELIRRASYFPFIRDLIEDPEEIRVSFWRSKKTGEVVLRKAYLKSFNLGNKAPSVIMIAEQDNGYFSGLTFFKMDRNSYLEKKYGHLLYAKGGRGEDITDVSD